MSTMADEMKQVTSQQVCLILGLALILAASVVTLAALNKDVGATFYAVGAVVVSVGGAFGWAKLNQLTHNVNQVNESVDNVKDLSNGRLTEMIEDNKRLREQLTELALRVPPPEAK